MNGGFQERAKNRKMKRKGGKWKIMVSLKKSELKKKNQSEYWSEYVCTYTKKT